jgi:hypothetical protein
MLENQTDTKPTIGLSDTLLVTAMLVIPWAIVGALLRSNSSIGFYLRLTTGTACVVLFKPLQLTIAAVIVFYCAVVLVRLLLGPSFIH